MLKMVLLYHLFFLYLASSVYGQESVEFIILHETFPETFQGLSHPGEAAAVAVQNEHLKEVSSSVLAAETWIRTHVLGHYPATNITTIVVGHTLFCEKDEQHKLQMMLLPSIKNIYYSLTRWGLQKEIKVSALFDSSCFNSKSDTFLMNPLLNFLQEINSPYLVNYDDLSAMKKLGFLNMKRVSLVVDRPRNAKSTSRKLSFIDSEVVYPFPARPTPLAPTDSPTGGSEPAFAATTPLPPLIGDISPPPFTLTFPPQLPPVAMSPESSHYGPHLPPCDPSYGGAPVGVPGGVVPAPEAGVHHSGLWCVAKPSVPPETLQEALDYACGQGGADCEAIQPNGDCYFPETVVAHASYAFNSYWQKTKETGGTCGFGGTAMLINSDPSFRHCQFIQN